MSYASLRFAAAAGCLAACTLGGFAHGADPATMKIAPAAVQPIVKAPVVTPKVVDIPVVKPVTVHPITIQPVSPVVVQPVQIAKPGVPATSTLPRLPSTPIDRVQPLPAGDPAITRGLVQAQKDALKEQRLGERANQASLAARSAQLGEQNKAIDKGMKESGEKADTQMDAAWTGMALGISQGATQIGGVQDLKQGGAAAKAPKERQAGILDQKAEKQAEKAEAHRREQKQERLEAAEDRRAREEARQERRETRVDKLKARETALKEERNERREAREDRIEARRRALKEERLDTRRDRASEGDVETVVQKVLLETNADNQAELKQQMKEVREANSKKSAMHKAADSENDARQASKEEKAGKTVAVVSQDPAAAVTKPTLTSRPCTPINPC